MGKPRMTALAIAIKAAEPLSDEEKQTLRDVLRPAPKPRQKGKGGGRSLSKRKAQTVSVASETVVGISDDGLCAKPECGKPLDDNVHQLISVRDYHKFVEPAGEASKGVGA